MNILFFLTPKEDVAFIYDDYTLRQAIEKIEYHKYTAIPILNRKGQYIGTLTEGDLLRFIKERYSLNMQEAEETPIRQVTRRWYNHPVKANSNMEDLVTTAMRQNFVPVVDDEKVFIGIIRRQDIMGYCYSQCKAKTSEKE